MINGSMQADVTIKKLPLVERLISFARARYYNGELEITAGYNNVVRH